MPTGVTVTEHGRIFVCFPQWGDHPACAVAEVCGRQLVPYPHPGHSRRCRWISVQNVVGDWHGGLWVLDTAAPDFSPPVPGGARLVKIELSTGRIAQEYTFPAPALRDPSIPDKELAGLVRTVVEKGASDGLASDAEGRVYAGDYESGSIRVISPDGGMRTLAHDPRILWPDTLSIWPDGYLYFISNQLERQPRFHCGKDLRRKPYSLFRIKIGALPAPTI